jgi:hypothetical protein
MFAPRPEVVAAELFRILRSGGILGMANWTPTSFGKQLVEVAAQGLGIVLARLVSDARVSCLSEGRTVWHRDHMRVDARDRLGPPCLPLHHLLLLLAGVVLVNADSVQQPLLQPMALQQALLEERVVGHQRLRLHCGFGLEGDQPS